MRKGVNRMTFELYKDVNKQYRWRLWSVNNKKICWSEAYVDKDSAKHSIDLVRKFAASATLKDSTVAKIF